MKITISYTDSEEQKAAAVLAALQPLLPGFRVHKNVSRLPLIRVNLSPRKPKKR